MAECTPSIEPPAEGTAWTIIVTLGPPPKPRGMAELEAILAKIERGEELSPQELKTRF